MMKRKPNKKHLALGRELHEIGVAARRKTEKFDDGKGWEWILYRPSQVAAWEAIGAYLDKHFTRKK